MQLSGQIVLITGGASGIGLSFAKALHLRGNTVLVCGRDQAKLDRVNVLGFHTMRCDLRQRDDILHLVDWIKSDFPKLNVLINNAAIYETYELFDQASHEQRIYDEVATNMIGPMTLIDHLLPLFTQQSDAAVVNVTSAIARVWHKDACVYCATKAGMSMFSQTLRRQLKHTSVKVFEVIPPLVDTDMCQSGRGKISPEELVDQSLSAMEKNQYEIRVGRTKLYYFLHAIDPRLAEHVIGRF